MMLIQIIFAIMLLQKIADIPSVSKNHFKHLKEKRYLVVVTVKNRVSYVKLSAESLRWLNIQEHADVDVFYGESDEYGIDDVHQWFSFAEIHSIEAKSPDDACRNSFEHFFHHHSHEVVINLDSDALLHPSWFSFLEKNLDKSDGVLSLYNSAAPYHVSFACDELTCQKNTTGALGIVITRHVLADVLDKVEGGIDFDWRFCKFFQDTNRKIIVPANSLIFHYGRVGAHGDSSMNHVEQAFRFNFSSFPRPIRAQATFYADGK